MITKYNRDVYIGFVLVVLGGILYLMANDLQIADAGKGGMQSVSFFPRLALGALIFFSAIMAISSLLLRANKPSKNPAITNRKAKWNMVLMLISIAAYLIVFLYGGLFVSTLPAIIVMMIIMGARLRNWKAIVLTSSIGTIGIYLFFDVLLR